MRRIGAGAEIKQSEEQKLRERIAELEAENEELRKKTVDKKKPEKE